LLKFVDSGSILLENVYQTSPQKEAGNMAKKKKAKKAGKKKGTKRRAKKKGKR
jgi:hypothetical protein